MANLELDKARDIAWKMIGIKDCYFFRSYLNDLEDISNILIDVSLWGAKGKIPPEVSKRIEDELIDYMYSL